MGLSVPSFPASQDSGGADQRVLVKDGRIGATTAMTTTSVLASTAAAVRPKDALDILNRRVKAGKQLDSELADFFRERAIIEEKYSTDLLKLSKKALSVPRDQLGGLHDVFTKVQTALFELSQTHAGLATDVTDKIERPLRSEHWARQRQPEQELARVVKEYDDEVKRLKKSDGDVKGLNFFRKAKKAEDKVSPELQPALDGAKDIFIQKAIPLYESMDETRIAAVRDSLSTFASSASHAAKVSSEIADRILASAYSVEVEVEMENFCTKYLTGSSAASFESSPASTRKQSVVTTTSFTPTTNVDSEGFSIPPPSTSTGPISEIQKDEDSDSDDGSLVPNSKFVVQISKNRIEDNPEDALKALQSFSSALQTKPTIKAMSEEPRPDEGGAAPFLELSGVSSSSGVNAAAIVDDFFFASSAATDGFLNSGSTAPISLQASISETVNALFSGGAVDKLLITGELSLSLPEGSPAAEPGRMAVLTVRNVDALERIVWNDRFAKTGGQLRPDQAAIDLSALAFAGGATVVAKYQVRVGGEKDSEDMCPLLVTSTWKAEETHMSVIVAYRLNDDPRLRMRLDDVAIFVTVEGGGDFGAVQSRPAGAWNPDRRTLAWRLGALGAADPATASNPFSNGSASPSVSLSSTSDPVRLLARFATSQPARPSVLAVQFSASGQLLSGIDVVADDVDPAAPVELEPVEKKVYAGRYGGI
ncbi:hypothetical protein HK405_007027 [Cladochytrium tenue]|nr:hypothetical protein HK405_007027 [Cladochytrium tenue]